MKNNAMSAVMIHVTNLEEGLNWYLQAFPGSIRRVHPDGLEWIDAGHTAIEVVHADAKVVVGAAGTVVYWHTDDFVARLNYLQSIGATLFRGPMNIENEMQQCQVLDPFGNPMGVRGSLR